MLSRPAVRIGAVILLVALCGGSPEPIAYAEGGGPGQGAKVPCQNGSCALSVWSNASSPGQAPVNRVPTQGSGSAPACVILPEPGGPVTGTDGQQYVLYRRQCGNGYPAGLLNGPALPNFAAMGPSAAPLPVLDPRTVALQAESELRLPRPAVEMSPSTFQVVGVPTWWWLGSGQWAPVSASAQVPGVSVTATATPVSVTWDAGDGSAPVECSGAGTAWRHGMDPAAASPDCGHLYHRSSAGAPGGVFSVTATAHWRVAWEGAGQAGAFPDLTSSGTTAVQVQEVQTVGEGPTR